MSDQRPGNPIQRLPLPALFVVIVVLWAGLQTVFAHGTITVTTVGVNVAGGIVLAAILTFGVGMRRRRLGGTDASLAFMRSVRKGVLPEGVATEGWPAELDRTARATRRSRWIVRIGGLLPFGLGVWAATDPSSRAIGVLLAALMVVGWVAGEVSARRQLTRIDRLRAQLGAAAA